MVSETLKNQIDRFLLALGFSLMIGIMVLGQSFRTAVGEAVGVLMNPVLALVGQENFHLILLVMASITAIYASLIQKYTIDWDLMRNTQERMELALDLCDEIVILSGGVLEKMEKDDLSNGAFKDKILQALRRDEND